LALLQTKTLILISLNYLQLHMVLRLCMPCQVILTRYDIIRFTIIMAENVITRYDPHLHLGMRLMTLIWCFRCWQV
jgi:hypothetical protein